MLGILARLLLTASAIAPVSFTFAWVGWYQNQKTVWITAGLIGVFLVFACIIVLSYARKHLEIMPFRAQNIEPADAESFSFMLLYLLPLFTDKIDMLNWELWIPVVAIFSIIVGGGYGYHFNPLLSLLRWHFYKVTSSDGVTFVLITKKHLRSASSVKRVGQLTEYILIDLDK